MPQLVDSLPASVLGSERLIQKGLLLAAQQGGCYEAAYKLLKHSPFHVDCKDAETGATPLYCAAARGDQQMTQLLLKCGARVDAIDSGGRTALHSAMCAPPANVLPIVQLLLSQPSAEACIHHCCKRGQTPLHAAAAAGAAAAARLLLQHGADAHVVDKVGHTPFDLACHLHNTDVKEVLLHPDTAVGQGLGHIQPTPLPPSLLHTTHLQPQHQLVEALPGQQQQPPTRLAAYRPAIRAAPESRAAAPAAPAGAPSSAAMLAVTEPVPWQAAPGPLQAALAAHRGVASAGALPAVTPPGAGYAAAAAAPAVAAAAPAGQEEAQAAATTISSTSASTSAATSSATMAVAAATAAAQPQPGVAPKKQSSAFASFVHPTWNLPAAAAAAPLNAGQPKPAAATVVDSGSDMHAAQQRNMLGGLAQNVSPYTTARQQQQQSGQRAMATISSQASIAQVEAKLTEAERALKADPNVVWIGANSLQDVVNDKDLMMSSSTLLGRGSFGVVRKAIWRGRTVAVKWIGAAAMMAAAAGSGADLDRRLRSFCNEARLLAVLRHPNIVAMYGVVRRPTDLGLVMQYMQRGSLFQLLHVRHAQISPGQRLQVAKDITAGLMYLHTRKPPVMHRDLTSGNVLIDKEWRTRLCDFGLSQALDSAPTGQQQAQPNTHVGTLAWMAPEVLRQGPEYVRRHSADEKGDVYSLGVLLWELATGDRPWAGFAELQIISVVGIQAQQLQVPADVDPRLAQLIRACMHPTPRKRPSLSKVQQRLGRLAAIEPSQLRMAARAAAAQDASGLPAPVVGVKPHQLRALSCVQSLWPCAQ